MTAPTQKVTSVGARFGVGIVWRMVIVSSSPPIRTSRTTSRRTRCCSVEVKLVESVGEAAEEPFEACRRA